MIRINPSTLEPLTSLDVPAWHRVPLGDDSDVLAAWATASAEQVATEADRPDDAVTAAATLLALATPETTPDVSARLIFLPDLGSTGIAYDVIALDPTGAPDDQNEAFRTVLDAERVGDGSLIDVTDENDVVVGLHSFQVVETDPIPVPGGSAVVPIAISRCVIRRTGTPLGTVDLLAIGVCPDVELAAFSMYPLHSLLLGDQLFE